METPAGGANRAEARGSYYQSYNHKDSIYFAFQDAATNLTIIAALNKLLLRNSGDLNGINRLGCGLLDAIFAEFTQNNDPNEYLAESVRPFQFQKFDGVIQRCMSKVHQAEMSGGSAVGGNRRQVNPNYDVLKQELTDVHLVMRKNLEDLMTRGERLEKINSYSDQLVDQSNKYYKKTVHINRMRLVKMYGPPAVVSLILILCFYIYFFNPPKQ
ncbi:vesicle transport protein SEC22 [Angomonas deanei]|uniref:Synaptobrevin, putative n=1 Tax=Angomonas deanei TaxID=59799 RepID=A0A7G2CCE9_9TRYP|nr:vesicle transport protein SEC22 [Angomonas deanei]CAD2217486.1 Synaptobrevin, putative [Angomonas deanei]|eukprot:EPY42257.1 vesicle transport protein SEC22 [Angomonas deanei]